MVLSISEDEVTCINYISIIKGESIKGLDISNNCHVALSYSKENCSFITIYKFIHAINDFIDDYGFTTQEININTNDLLFNNKNNSLIISVFKTKYNAYNNYWILTLNNDLTYILIDNITEEFPINPYSTGVIYNNFALNEINKILNKDYCIRNIDDRFNLVHKGDS